MTRLLLPDLLNSSWQFCGWPCSALSIIHRQKVKERKMYSTMKCSALCARISFLQKKEKSLSVDNRPAQNRIQFVITQWKRICMNSKRINAVQYKWILFLERPSFLLVIITPNPLALRGKIQYLTKQKTTFKRSFWYFNMLKAHWKYANHHILGSF